jgi:tetratricopeptide (TPR) repeat protein
VAEFQNTRHFLACIEATPEVMPASFAPGEGTFVAPDTGLHFEMGRKGTDFLQTAIQTTPAGPRRTSAPIALVYGGRGVLDEVYFTWHGDRLYELPMAWLHPDQHWGVNPFYRGSTGDFSREMTPRCALCHNTWFEHVPGTANEYKRDNFILGVTCERCHGPGRDHVEFHRAHPEAETAHAVVHPGRLSRERQMDVCAQCHSNAIKRRGPPFSYRPGQPLQASFRTAVSKYPEDDHVANQVEYLRKSKCFQKSDELTCITCHNPHRPADTRAVRGACLKCHQPKDCGEQDRLPVAVRDNCAGCHLPQRTWMNVHFHTEDDQYVPPIRRFQHRIAVHPEATKEVLLAWHRTQSDPDSRREADRLAKDLVDHWLTEAENRRREHRFLAAIGALREALRVDPAPATRVKLKEAVTLQTKLDAELATAMAQMEHREFPEAAETLKGVLAIKPDLAMAHGKLGTIKAVLGKNEEAVEQLRAVARCDPNEPYGYNMLGWLAYLQDRPEEALDNFLRADELEPYSAEINFRMGLAQVKLNHWPEAAEHFRLVLTIDPKHVAGCKALSQVLLRQNKSEEAVRVAQRAVRLTVSKDPDALANLAEAYVGAGRSADADATAAKALEAVRTSDPSLAIQIRRRMEEIKTRK